MMPEIKVKKCVITGCTNPIYKNYTICESHAGKLGAKA